MLVENSQGGGHGFGKSLESQAVDFECGDNDRRGRRHSQPGMGFCWPNVWQRGARPGHWATSGVTVSINGKKQEVSDKPSSYFTLDRTWNDGDKIEVAMPMSLHLAPLPDEPTTQAAMYGPLVLAGRLGSRGLMKDHIYGPEGPDEARAIPVPALVGSVDKPDWLEQVKGQTLAFQTTGQTETIDLAPLYQNYDERYTVYWKVNKKSA